MKSSPILSVLDGIPLSIRNTAKMHNFLIHKTMPKHAVEKTMYWLWRYKLLLLITYCMMNSLLFY